MNPALVQRQAALAAVALLATIGALALGREEERSIPSTPAPAETTPAEEAEAGVFGPGRFGEATACGVDLTPQTIGVAHPVLPCGVDLVIAFGSREVRTEVIERGPEEPGRQFDLSAALARELGFPGSGRIRWRFAGD